MTIDLGASIVSQFTRLIRGHTRQADVPARPAEKQFLADNWWAVKEPRHAPPRKQCLAKALVDGKATMEAMSKALRDAKKTIFITGWMMTPRVALRRPATSKSTCGDLLRGLVGVDTADAAAGNGRYRWQRLAREGARVEVDLVANPWLFWLSDDSLLWHLIEAAASNVDVRVLLWDDTWGAISTADGPAIGELKVAAQLVKAAAPTSTGSIRALRVSVDAIGPDPLNLRWSHHQKSLIVDGWRAFIGGVDLCLGRWDTEQHSLDGAAPEYKDDFYNTTIEEASPAKHPRLPWHDVHMEIQGRAAWDVQRNFLQRWYYQEVGTNVQEGTSAAEEIDAISEEANRDLGSAWNSLVGAQGLPCALEASTCC